ncbi:hypothetical protein QA634_12345 [Methylobacterium sp. CB376]|uniref:hypothetical protein n=1 Tax=unclassified Methylobacterium TaxID=2615210 RepID=UPI0002E49FF6|nr:MULTISPECIES: hypothetical protein [Methylobacterium]WFT82582.1 hypothetical protein QA634_12345 [Methylobacterium nodulans]
MSEPASRRWTVPEFFAWQERREARDDLVGGVPVRVMTGARDPDALTAASPRLVRGAQPSGGA